MSMSVTASVRVSPALSKTMTTSLPVATAVTMACFSSVGMSVSRLTIAMSPPRARLQRDT